MAVVASVPEAHADPHLVCTPVVADELPTSGKGVVGGRHAAAGVGVRSGDRRQIRPADGCIGMTPGELAKKARPTIGLAIGDTIADGEHLDLIDPRRCEKVDDVALMRLH